MTETKPSDYLRSSLGYVQGLRMLMAAFKDGTLADPYAMEREINRAESSIAHCIGLLAGDPPADSRAGIVPSPDNDPRLAQHLRSCEACD